MNKMLIGALAAPTLLLAVAAAADSGTTVNVRTAMVEGVNPAALAIWDVSNNAVNDDGEPDGSSIDADKLAQLREAAQMLTVYADELSQAGTIQASGPDLVSGKVPEGVASREQIQVAIDADPEGFRALAVVMGEQAQAIGEAVASGDMQAVAEQLVGFDGACQSCHERYWYVQQPELAIRRAER
jgi:cytochrome c556